MDVLGRAGTKSDYLTPSPEIILAIELSNGKKFDRAIRFRVPALDQGGMAAVGHNSCECAFKHMILAGGRYAFEAK